LDLDAPDRRLSGVEIALRQRADRIESQYKATIGEMLFYINS
jgi:hypothetical protein